MKQAWETVIALRLVWFRVLCYFLIPFADALYEQFKDWDGAMWDAAHWFDVVKAFIFSTETGLMCLVAFIDNSLSRAHSEQELRREQQLKQQQLLAQQNKPQIPL